MRIDEQAFTDAGMDGSPDQIIALWDEGETVDLLADRIGNSGTELTWTSQDGVLTLTTAEKADWHYSTARYYIGDLLKTDRSGDSIIELLQAETPGPWDNDEPGTDRSRCLWSHLFVRQTSEMHLRRSRGCCWHFAARTRFCCSIGPRPIWRLSISSTNAECPTTGPK